MAICYTSWAGLLASLSQAIIIDINEPPGTCMTMAMESIPFLFRLPKAWLTAFISDWLPIQEIANLDTAITNHEHRDHFLSCLRQLNPEIHWSVHNLSLQWLSLRQFSVFSIEFNCDVTKIQSFSNLYLPLLISLEVDFQEGDGTIDEAILYLLRTCPEIQSIKLQTSSAITDVGVRHIADCCPLLQDFHFCPWVGVSVDISTLVYLFRHCPLLESVDLIQAVLEDYSGSDLRQLKEFGHVIESISVYNDPDVNINAKDIIELLLLCPKLTELDYTSTRTVDDSLMLQRLGEICPSITKFNYNKVSDDVEIVNVVVPIGMYVNAFRRCSHLTEISFYGDVMQHFTDADFKCLEEFGPLMSSLVLETQREDDQLTSQGLSTFIGQCPNLNLLVCKGMDEGDAVILHRLGERCPTLHQASLTALTNVTDDAFLALLQGCPKLSGINISCQSTVNIPTDAIFAHRFNPILKTIDLCVGGVMWNQMTVATCFSECHELEVFKVVWGETTDDGAGIGLLDTGLAVLASGCPKLREIKLYSSPLLTINGLLHLGETCSRLSELYIHETIVGDRPSDNLYPFEEMSILRQRFPAMKVRVSTYRILGGDDMLEDVEVEAVDG